MLAIMRGELTDLVFRLQGSVGEDFRSQRCLSFSYNPTGNARNGGGRTSAEGRGASFGLVRCRGGDGRPRRGDRPVDRGSRPGPRERAAEEAWRAARRAAPGNPEDDPATASRCDVDDAPGDGARLRHARRWARAHFIKLSALVLRARAPRALVGLDRRPSRSRFRLPSRRGKPARMRLAMRDRKMLTKGRGKGEGSRLAGVIAATFAILVGSAARAAEAPLTLTWTAPAQCPARDEVVADVTRRLASGDSSKAPVVARAIVKQHKDGTWHVTLTTEQSGARGQRSLQAKTCAEVASATALILALTIDPRAAAFVDAPVAAAPAQEPTPTTPPTATPNPNPTPAPPRRAPSSLRPFLRLSAVLPFGFLPTFVPGISSAVGAVRRDFSLELTGTFLSAASRDIGAGQGRLLSRQRWPSSPRRRLRSRAATTRPRSRSSTSTSGRTTLGGAERGANRGAGRGPLRCRSAGRSSLGRRRVSCTPSQLAACAAREGRGRSDAAVGYGGLLRRRGRDQ